MVVEWRLWCGGARVDWRWGSVGFRVEVVEQR